MPNQKLWTPWSITWFAFLILPKQQQQQLKQTLKLNNNICKLNSSRNNNKQSRAFGRGRKKGEQTLFMNEHFALRRANTSLISAGAISWKSTTTHRERENNGSDKSEKWALRLLLWLLRNLDATRADIACLPVVISNLYASLFRFLPFGCAELLLLLAFFFLPLSSHSLHLSCVFFIFTCCLHNNWSCKIPAAWVRARGASARAGQSRDAAPFGPCKKYGNGKTSFFFGLHAHTRRLRHRHTLTPA